LAVTSVGDRVRIRSDIGLASEKQDLASDDYVQIVGGLGVDLFLPINMIGRLGVALGYRRHAQEDAFFGSRREDRIVRTYGRLVIPNLQLAGFAPELGVQYETINSTVDYFDQNGLELDLRFVRQF
jgi:hypothetical protein